MKKFFSKYKIIFYFLNFFLIFLYLFPGSLSGLIIYDNINKQPQITSDFIVSSNHFYIFFIISFLGLLSFEKERQIKALLIYLISLSVIIEFFHLFIPERSFQWSDLFGNLSGVIVVIVINNLINKYGLFKK
jgi:VanZ family protein